MVVWIVRQKKFAHREEMVQELVQTIPEIKSVVLNLNTREDNVILGKQEEVDVYKRQAIDRASQRNTGALCVP